MPICFHCGKGRGKRYTKDQNVYYYYLCHICIGDIKSENYCLEKIKENKNLERK